LVGASRLKQSWNCKPKPLPRRRSLLISRAQQADSTYKSSKDVGDLQQQLAQAQAERAQLEAALNTATTRLLQLGVPLSELSIEKLSGSKLPVQSQKESPAAAAIRAQIAEVRRLWDSGESTLAWLELNNLSETAFSLMDKKNKQHSTVIKAVRKLTTEAVNGDAAKQEKLLAATAFLARDDDELDALQDALSLCFKLAVWESGILPAILWLGGAGTLWWLWAHAQH
jgi:hypothetical protein